MRQWIAYWIGSWVGLLLCVSMAVAADLGTPFDLQGLIDKELASGSRRVVVPPGRYRVAPRNAQHLLFRGLHDVEIIADGVEMVCTETTRALTVADCRNVTIRGLAIDYDPLPFTQGRITAISADNRVHEIELFDGYPRADRVRPFKYEIFRPDTRTLRCEDRYPSRVNAVDARHSLVVQSGGSDRGAEQVGDLIVIAVAHAPHGSMGHAVECSNSVNVRLENIDLYASNCFGFLETNCDGNVYYRCKIDRRSPADDPVPRASPRLRSLNADAFHSKCAVKGPAYIECTARFMGDDAVNINGEYHLIVASRGRQLRVLAKRDMNIGPGDAVEIVDYDGRRLPNAKAVSVEPAGAILPEELSFLMRQHMDEGLRTANGGILRKAFNITIDREIRVAMGSVICSTARVGNGFAVRGCTFGYNRSRGILIKASHGEVIGNWIEGCWMSGIQVAPEYWWLEAGSSSDLMIAGNTIVSCRGIPIKIEATAGNGKTAPAGAHQNITIAGNAVRNCSRPGIRVTSTRGLRIENNALDLLPAGQSPTGFPRPGGQAETRPVVGINCEP